MQCSYWVVSVSWLLWDVETEWSLGVGCWVGPTTGLDAVQRETISYPYKESNASCLVFSPIA
jgi:hypothetical protein